MILILMIRNLSNDQSRPYPNDLDLLTFPHQRLLHLILLLHPSLIQSLVIHNALESCTKMASQIMLY